MTFQDFSNIVRIYKAKVHVDDNDIYVRGWAFVEGQVLETLIDKDSGDYQLLIDLQTEMNYSQVDGLGAKFMSIRKPAVSGLKVKTHDFGDPRTWYSNSVRTTLALGSDVVGTYALPQAVDINSPNMPFGIDLQEYRVEVQDDIQTIYPTLSGDQIVLPLMSGPTTATYSKYTDSRFMFTTTKRCQVIDAAILIDAGMTAIPDFVFEIMGPSGTLKAKRYRHLIDYLSESDLQDFKTIPSIAGQPAKYYFRWDYRQPIALEVGMSLSLSLNTPIAFSAVATFSVLFI